MKGTLRAWCNFLLFHRCFHVGLCFQPLIVCVCVEQIDASSTLGSATWLQVSLTANFNSWPDFHVTGEITTSRCELAALSNTKVKLLRSRKKELHRSNLIGWEDWWPWQLPLSRAPKGGGGVLKGGGGHFSNLRERNPEGEFLQKSPSLHLCSHPSRCRITLSPLVLSLSVFPQLSLPLNATKWKTHTQTYLL